MELGRPRTAAEVRQVRLAKITYGQMGLALVGAAALVYSRSLEADLLSGWNILWLVFGAAIVLAGAVQAYRKWRYDRS